MHQRRAMREDFLAGASLKELAAKYHVATKTVQKWVHRERFTDRRAAPHRRRTHRPPGAKAAVLRARRANPAWGTRRLTHELRRYLPGITRHHVRHILRVARRQRPGPVRRPRTRHPIPVGWHRVQMDIQQLPAVAGGTGFAYKISVIHLRTRMKYSEIHPDYRSATAAGVLQRAQDWLPPFWLVWTDNALTFTMRYTPHPERKTAFQQRLMTLDLLHGTCAPRSPWQNGIIERSHRTDNDECFHVLRFADEDDRRYQLRLFEMYYNTQRPHQGLDGLTPVAVFQRDYAAEASLRMQRRHSDKSAFQGTR